LGRSEINQEQRQSCRDQHDPEEFLALQREWERLRGRTLWQRGRSGLHYHRDDERLVTPQDLDLDAFAKLGLAHQPLQVFHLTNWLPIEFENKIAAFHATEVSGTIAHQTKNHHAFTWKWAPLLRCTRDILNEHAKMATALCPNGAREHEQGELDSHHRESLRYAPHPDETQPWPHEILLTMAASTSNIAD
jgi:hypothetical protein